MALTKKQIKEFKEAEEAAEDSYVFRGIADDIAEAVTRDGQKRFIKKQRARLKTTLTSVALLPVFMNS